MTRRFLLILLLLVPAPLAAQQAARLAPNVPMVVWYPVPRMLAAFPAWWRDSVQSAFIHAIPTHSTPWTPAPTTGSATIISIQMLRDGRVYRAKVATASDNPSIDSTLRNAALAAGRAGAFPPFPPGVDGVGREVRLLAYLPIVRARETDIVWHGEFTAAALSPKCDSEVNARVQWVPAALVATVDSTSVGDGMTAWAARSLPSLTEAFVPLPQISASTHPSVFFVGSLDPAFSGTMHLVLTSSGRLRSAQLIVPTGQPTLDSALTALVARADSQLLFPPPPSTQGDTAILDLAFAVTRVHDQRSTVLGALTIGIWPVETEPALQHMGPMRYPGHLYEQKVGGRVVLQYVVAADGKADPNSLVVVTSPAPAFSQASLDLIKGTRYAPGKIGSCAVPTLVRQNVNFTADRPLVRRDVVTERPGIH